MVSNYQFDAKQIIEICRQNDVAMVGIFGSSARGEATDKSDVDLLVRFKGRKSLLTLVRLERELEMALGRKVDLLTEAAISPYLHDRIMKDLQVQQLVIMFTITSCTSTTAKTRFTRLLNKLCNRSQETVSRCYK